MANNHRPRQSRTTSHRLAPSWSMRTMPSMAKIRWKYVAGGEHLLRNCFARPGKTGKEELREAGAEEDERRRLGMLEPGAGCLAHEARRQDEQRCERKQLQRLAERGKAVE